MINQAILILSTLLMGLSISDNSTQLTIQVEVKGENAGLVQLLLFKGGKGFPDQATAAIKTASAKVQSGKAVFKFKNLESGIYAVSAFHDTDGDGEMRKNLFGIPKDLYGFSNDARATFSAPTFDSASFNLTSGEHTISFTLK
ncbi:DUF2141 domain-containing protein [Cyclobacterium sp. 1_MG-2023]|uniref:DUF2141 domain-containing protein n=1 Tax=Cyclobacterium sp. 1_MG-2023 TaxID=3062681 RepID=UPI0026E177A4|nr:DUF2141 domain-containing protein [Cyclobacterium sp. 1_MG-2023]MDO6440281.1 DUF2141 domain-containing protein [Cyclobacterium sp. 1_MG-2023]